MIEKALYAEKDLTARPEDYQLMWEALEEEAMVEKMKLMARKREQNA